MRRLNVKLLVGLVMSGVLLGGAVHAVHVVQVDRNAGHLLKQATRAEERGQPERAVDDLRQYLAFRPGDDDALIRYGLLLARLATTDEERLRVVSVLGPALGRRPDRHDVRRRIAQVEYALGRFAEARDELKTLLDGPSRDDGELEDLYGQCLARDGKDPKAAEWLEKSIVHAPGRIDTYVRLASLQRDRRKQPALADAILDRMVAANDRSPRAYLTRARYRAGWNPGDSRAIGASAEDVSRARQLAPDDAEVLLAAAEMAIATGRREEARAALEHGIEMHPGDARMHRAMAKLDLMEGQAVKAEASLRRGVDALAAADVKRGEGPAKGGAAGEVVSLTKDELTWSLAELLIQEGKEAEAAELVARLRKADLRPEPLDYLDALILIRGERWLEAARLLERAHPALAAAPSQAGLAILADLALARCYEQLGESDKSHEAYRRIVDREPESIPARLGMASALAVQGKLDEALDEYRKIATRVPGVQVEVARLLIHRTLRQPAPRRVWRDAEQALDAASRAVPEAVDIPLLRAEVLDAQGQVDAARELLSKARDKQPEKVEFPLALALMAARQGDMAEASRVLGEAERRLGDRVELRLARAGYWALRGGEEAKLALAGLEQKIEKFNARDRRQLLIGLAGAYDRIGQSNEAGRLLGRLAAEQPHDPAIRLALFELALRAGDDAAMQRVVGEVRRLEDTSKAGEPEGVFWRLAKARHLTWLAGQGRADQSAIREAHSLLVALARLRPAWSSVPFTEGMLDDLGGDKDGAIKCYQRAVDLGERDPRAARRLVQLLHERRRYADADELIGKLQQQGTLSPVLRRLAAENSLLSRNFSRAQEWAVQGVSAESKDYRELIWLAQVLWASKGVADDRAEAALRRAVSLSGDVPDPWVVLIGYLARTGQREKAERALDEARAKLPKDLAPAALAPGYDLIGRRDLAEAQYREALDARPDDAVALRNLADFYARTGQFAQADPHLRKLAGPSATKADSAWARRCLALGIALSGTPKIDEALSLIEQNLVADPGSLDDLRTKGAILATRPEHRAEAIRILEDVARTQVPTPREKYVLATLNQREGDWAKARGQMQQLLTSTEEEPIYTQCLRSYTLGLVGHGQLDEARVWLATLKGKDPRSPQTLEIEARLLAARGKGDQAASILKDLALGQDELQVQAVAKLLDELRLDDAAEEMYRAYAARSKKHESTLDLAEYLGHRGKMAEAVDLVERAWKTCDPLAVAKCGATILQNTTEPGEEYCQRVAGRIEQLIREKPGPQPYVLLAAVRAQQRRYKDAEGLYRKAIEMDPGNVTAMNNLAWQLALKDGRGPEALALIQRAIEILGPAPELVDTRAVVYLSMGQPEPAIKDLKRSLALRPSAPAFFHLARAQSLAKNRPAAQEALKQSRTLGLRPDGLDRLEAASYSQLVGDLDRK